jgi:ADP-ribose pyrophosphatase YjhB (NUDIX family)
MEEKNEYKNFNHRVDVKRSSYVMAIIRTDEFIKKGAIQLSCGIYWIKREYDGSSTGETCALLGVPIFHIFDFLDENGDLINKIRNEEQLQYIEGIDTLSCRSVQLAISKFKVFFRREDENELMIFNIEPKGSGKLERAYPIPLITVPGGTMEEKDLLDFERCAMREFQEETGIDIANSHQKISREKIKKGYRFTHFPSSQKRLKMIYSKNKFDQNKKVVSMYYLVRID